VRLLDIYFYNCSYFVQNIVEFYQYYLIIIYVYDSWRVKPNVNGMCLTHIIMYKNYRFRLKFESIAFILLYMLII